MGHKPAQRTWRTIFRYIIPLFISVGLCYLLFTGVDLPETVAAMRRCDFSWLVGSLVFSIVAQICRAYRWRLQLKPIGVNPPAGIMVNSIFGTYAVNLVLPRLGEIWRTGYIAQRQHAPFPTVFGSMVADRLADSVTVLVVTVFTFAMASDAMTEFMKSTDIGSRVVSAIGSPWLWIGLTAAAAACVALFRSHRQSSAAGRIAGILRGAWQGFSSIARMPHKGSWLMLTVMIWGSYFVETWVSMYAFDATASLIDRQGVMAALVTFVFGTVAMAIPSNGGIGPWQGAIVIALAGIYGIDRNVALAFATVSLGLQTLLTIVLGLYTFAAIAVDRRRNHST